MSKFFKIIYIKHTFKEYFHGFIVFKENMSYYCFFEEMHFIQNFEDNIRKLISCKLLYFPWYLKENSTNNLN